MPLTLQTIEELRAFGKDMGFDAHPKLLEDAIPDLLSAAKWALLNGFRSGMCNDCIYSNKDPKEVSIWCEKCNPNLSGT